MLLVAAGEPLTAGRRPMSMALVRTTLCTVVLAAAAAAATACASGSAVPGEASMRSSFPGSGRTLDHTVTLNDGESLRPPPAHSRPALTAVQAWRAYAARNDARINRTHLPKGARAYLAVFSTSGSIKHRLVYGIRIPGCHPVYMLAAPTPYPTGCVGWQILDASTSNDLDLAWEGL
jgi:hypothetical protein